VSYLRNLSYARIKTLRHVRSFIFKSRWCVNRCDTRSANTGEPSSKMQKKKRDIERREQSAIMLRAGTAENKLNRLLSLKDVKLFHPVQLTPSMRVFDAARRNESPNIMVPKVLKLPSSRSPKSQITHARYSGCTCSTLYISVAQVHVRHSMEPRVIGKGQSRRRESRARVERGAKRTP